MSKNCRKCKTGTMTEKETTQDLTVKGVSLHVTGLRHFECEACKAQVETPIQIDYNAELIRLALAQKRAETRETRLLTSAQVKKLRLDWRITQKQASKIFGGGPTAFAKYEADDVVQSAAMDNLLRVAAAVPEAARWLATRANENISIQHSADARLADLSMLVRYLSHTTVRRPRATDIFSEDGGAKLGRFSMSQGVASSSCNDKEFANAA